MDQHGLSGASTSLSEAEAKARADHILYLEGTGVPLEEATSRVDHSIAIHLAWGHSAISPMGIPDPYAAGVASRNSIWS